jgi:ABC-type branched-subunit amino acid transport system substrate-binding protein
MRLVLKIACGAAALAALSPAAPARACTVTVGVVMELTGPAGPYGQAASKSVELAFHDLNQAGAVLGCTLAADTRDSQSQGAVGVDAARQLVDIAHVPAIIGAIISSVTIPIVTSVTAPAHVVQISPASSSPTLTTLAEKGETGGWFFRTITSDTLQGVAAARYAMDLGLKKLAVIHVNNDFGVNMVKQFSHAYTALGGTITSDTPYNERQSSYQAEVTSALGGNPDGLYLVSYPVDGATIARAWISQGGPRKFLLNDGMNSSDFIDAVGAKYLDDAHGTSSGTETTPSTTYFNEAYKAFSGLDPGSPAADRAYDAAALVGLAIAQAGKADSAAIRDGIRAVVDPNGTPIYAGPEEFKKGLGLLHDGKPIRYVGVIGPISFDANGDITGPFREWAIEGGKVVTKGQLSTADIDKIQSQFK